MTKHKSAFFCSFKGMATLVLLVMVGVWLFSENQQSLAQLLPYMILLLCPLMHIFMHNRHSQHRSSSEGKSEAYQKGLQEGKKQSEK